MNATLLPMEKSLGAIAPGYYADIVALSRGIRSPMSTSC
jgi:hypothetical protein